MTVRERILAIRLLEKQEKNPEYMEHIGIHVQTVSKNVQEERNCSE